MITLLKKPRIIILLLVLLLSIIAINPQLDGEGVAIRQVVKDSAAALAGIESPSGAVSPTHREVILSVNGRPVSDEQSYYAAVDEIYPNQTFTIQTKESTYRLQSIGEAYTDPITNETLVRTQDIGLVVYPAPGSNIRKGLDLSGGTRVVMQPENPVPQEDLQLVLENIEQRLNVFGLSDIVVRDARDLAGNDFIIVEIAGANKDEVRELLGSQGLFEAQINNETVFSGGDDITFVCRTPDCSGIDTTAGGCQLAQGGGWICPFAFSISLSEAAAERQAAATRDLEITTDLGSAYLSSPLELKLDGELVDSLNIAADLKGRAVTDIQISGSGLGATQEAALEDMSANMKQLQTVLITGSLPVKLDIVKTDAISPILGAEFLKNAFFMAFAAIAAVVAVVFIRYRQLVVSIPMVITVLSEGVIILGFASLIGWNIDLAAIAGIIIAIGTGVDDQIVIIDEFLRGSGQAYQSWKDRMKNAFFIIITAFATTVFAMVPLLFAGAGLLKGFAITTIIGVTAGVLITRPAFAVIIQHYLKEE